MTYGCRKRLRLVLVVIVSQMHQLLLKLVLNLAKGDNGSLLGRVGLAEIAGVFGGLRVLADAMLYWSSLVFSPF